MFAGKTKKIHVGFTDPSGGAKDGYAKTLNEIKDTLLPKVKEALEL